MGKKRLAFIQKVAGGGSGGVTAKAKRDFEAAAKEMNKETFLGQLLEQWYPMIKSDADTEEEIKKARKRIDKSKWFKHIFDTVGITDEDIRGVIEDIKEVKVKAGEQQVLKEGKPKMGRNELCWCGSGKKYKKCCGSS